MHDHALSISVAFSLSFFFSLPITCSLSLSLSLSLTHTLSAHDLGRYPPQKVEENVQCEIMRVVADEARSLPDHFLYKTVYGTNLSNIWTNVK